MYYNTKMLQKPFFQKYFYFLKEFIKNSMLFAGKNS